MTNAPTRVEIDPVLVANRGEIAVRIMRSAREMGLDTVAIYSDADADAPHVRLGDSAIRVGPAPARESYLNIERIVDAAVASGARSVHPGYGFLSENAIFAEACASQGLTFVGPPSDAIRVMGDKSGAKARVSEVGVSVLPGYHGPDQSEEALWEHASAIGFPLMVKAAAGGGGKGMRLVTRIDEFADALDSCRREALSAFGDDRIILERALRKPRHVEVQVLADAHGNIVTLGERDCSMQRRHQKVVEEAPSPVVDVELRRCLERAATTVAREVDYVGVGTVEFLVDPSDRGFYFLEMNTRLQVEHPVTEMTTGIDLVEWQLRVARGEELTFTSDNTDLLGHAMEARLYAEDPSHGFVPSSGQIEALHFGEDVRVDSGVEEGTLVGTHYDPLLAKVIAHGHTREIARRRLVKALTNTTLLGVRTNRTFLIDMLTHPTFVDGGVETGFVDSFELSNRGGPPDSTILRIAASLFYNARLVAAERRSPGLGGWSSRPPVQSRLTLKIDGHETNVSVSRHHGATTVEIDGGPGVECHVIGRAVEIGNTLHEYRVAFPSPSRMWLQVRARDYEVSDTLFNPRTETETAGEGVLTAPMHGQVVSVDTAVGQQVQRGDVVVVIEAMKMEHAIKADIDGTVALIGVRVGSTVVADAVIANIEPDERRKV